MSGPIDAGGGVLFRQRDGMPEFLVCHRPRYDDWSLPKGKVEEGEDLQACAVREVREETGFTAEVHRLVGTVAYSLDDGRMKRVRYWLMEAGRGRFRPGTEVDRVEWHRAGAARARLSHARDRLVVTAAERAITQPDSGIVYLVRHVHAGRRTDWSAADHLRPISTLGDDQLDTLMDYLTARPITYIASSPYVRCVQTVAPLADLLDIEVDEQQALVEGASPDDSVALIRKLGGEAAVLSTHGDIAGGIIEHLAAAGVPLDGPLAWAKGSVWELDLAAGEVVGGRYVPPSPTAD